MPTPSSASGADSEESSARSRCHAEEREPATLVLWAPDYDGGNKAGSASARTATDAIVGGSQVVRG